MPPSRTRRPAKRRCDVVKKRKTPRVNIKKQDPLAWGGRRYEP